MKSLSTSFFTCACLLFFCVSTVLADTPSNVLIVKFKPNLIKSASTDAAPPFSGQIEPLISNNTISAQSFDPLDVTRNKRIALFKSLNEQSGLYRVYKVTYPTTSNAVQAFQAYSGDSTVESVEYDGQLTANEVPNDPYYSYQKWPPLIHASDAWGITHGSPTVIVAVIDSGVDTHHPELQGNIVPGVSFVPNSTVDDENGHGSEMAGIIGAVGNNRDGIAGVNWVSKIMPVKILNATGGGPASSLIPAINWAVSHGADVINMSLGYTSSVAGLQTVVNNAVAAGVILVASMGNDSISIKKYPAACDNVISVGSVNSTYQKNDFSTYGPWIDVVAFGGADNDSKGIGGVLSLSAAHGYNYVTGTSPACAIVSGVVALMLSVNPYLTPTEALQILRSTAQDVGSPGFDNETGAGLVNAFAAVSLAKSKYGADNPTYKNQVLSGTNTYTFKSIGLDGVTVTSGANLVFNIQNNAQIHSTHILPGARFKISPAAAK